MYCMQFGWQFRELLKFAEGGSHFMARKWLDYGPMRVYIRISPRLVVDTNLSGPTVNLALALSVQIANIDMPEAYQRRGLFTRMVGVIRENTALPIMLENCRMDFADHLLTKGWELISADPVTKNIVLR